MFTLPLSASDDESGLPLAEHAGLLLISGLLHGDLDDQYDAIRAALEIDPFLSTWTVLVAHREHQARITTIELAARWLAEHFACVVSTPASLVRLRPIPPHRRAAWRQLSVGTIAAARQARQLASQADAASPSRAFWLALLGGVRQQFERIVELGGGLPWDDIQPPWPPWLIAASKSVDAPGRHDALHLAVDNALRNLAGHPDLAAPWVDAEEPLLWFRTYPEFRMLAPSLLEKLQRLAALEERFEESLQREKMASLRQLAYGASHEINNPLANISTRAQTLLAGEHDTERRRKLTAIKDQAFRAHEMIADLMLYAKPPRLDAEEFAFGPWWQSLEDELEPQATRRGVRLRLQLADPWPRLQADPVQLAVAVKAICVNACEAMEQGGELIVTAAPSGKAGRHVEITIEDTGPGLSGEAQRHLFDPFYSGREAGRGLGFGLSKAWRIVEEHGGTIAVQSRPGWGCKFTLRLPAAVHAQAALSTSPSNRA